LNSNKDRRWDKALHSGVAQKGSRPEKSAACMGAATSTLNRDLNEVSRLNALSATMRPKVVTTAVMILVAIHFAGCAGIGPQTINRDRFDYVSAISDSWKRQTLLNLLKTRYLDAPVFMDVASVINQYALEQEVGLGLSGEIYNKGEPSFISPEIGVKGRYTDRPTITYNPLMGGNYARSVLKPIPNSAILLLIEAGYPIDYVLRTCVQTINGLDNRKSGRLVLRDADPEFYELLALLRHIQAMEGIVMRAKSVNGKRTLSVLFKPPDKSFSTELKKAIQLLNLEPGVSEFRVVFSSYATNRSEIAVLGRSMLQIFSAYAAYIDVPESHVSQGRVVATEQDHLAAAAGFPPLIQVQNGKTKPDDAFVSVPYRDRFFWIDDRDIHSKGMFFFLMILFSLTERGQDEQAAPVLTVPTN
jgi:hypothetical protein